MQNEALQDKASLGDLNELRERLLDELKQTKQRLAELGRHRQQLEYELIEVARLVHDAELKVEIRLGDAPRASRKNIKLLRARSAIRKALMQRRDGRPISNGDLYAMVKELIPDLKDSTFRYYLHRFKKDGFLQKKGDLGWVLTERKEASTESGA